MASKYSQLLISQEAVIILDEHIEKVFADPDTYVRLHTHCLVCRRAFPGYSFKEISMLLSQYHAMRKDRWVWEWNHGGHCGHDIYARNPESNVCKSAVERVGVEA